MPPWLSVLVVASGSLLVVLASAVVRRRHDSAADGSPPRVFVYTVAGSSPLFFSGLCRATAELAAGLVNVHTLIIDLSRATVPDRASIVGLDSAVRAMLDGGVAVILAGGSPSLERVLRELGVPLTDGRLALCSSLDEALALVRAFTTDRPVQHLEPTLTC